MNKWEAVHAEIARRHAEREASRATARMERDSKALAWAQSVADFDRMIDKRRGPRPKEDIA